MTDLTEGDRYYDPAIDEEFEIADSVDTTGMSVAEMDRLAVPIRFDDGETQTVPHERFRGRMTYEEVASA
jgi:hypothetical protein